MELLKEALRETLVESILEENGIKRWYISGPTLQGSIVNHNRRQYPTPVLENAVNIHIKDRLDKGRCVGELSHPLSNSQEINLENISHKFVKVEKIEDNFYTKALLLDTPKGKIAQNLTSEGIQLAFSSRGLGNVVESNGVKVVKDYQLICLADIVFDPSGPMCFVDAIQENKEWVFENGQLVEKDLSEELDIYKKVLKEAKAKDIQKVVKECFNDYIKKLSLK